MTLTIEEAQARRAAGRRRQVEERCSLNTLSAIDQRLNRDEEPAPTLPRLDVHDATTLYCLKGCGRRAWLDRETIIATNGHRARWVCAGAMHSGWVRLVGVEIPDMSRPVERGKHYHDPQGAWSL